MASRPDYKNQEKKLLTFFAALCLYLSALEYAVPKPLPFLRLGLANLPILLALELFPLAQLLLLTLLKIFLQAFISGTFFSYIFLFSVSGSLASSLSMIFVYKISLKARAWNKSISFVGLSVAGALANNAAQIGLSYFLLFGKNTRYIAPLLLVFGLVSGVLLGLFCNSFASNSAWYRLYCGKIVENEGENALDSKNLHSLSTKDKNREKACGKKGRFALVKFVFSLLSLVFFLQIKNLFLLWAAVLFFLLFDEVIRRGRVKLLPSFVVVLSVTFFSLLSPTGRVLFTLGSWKITQTALEIGLHKSGVLVGMVFISQCAVDKNLWLPGRVGLFVKNIFSYFDRLTDERMAGGKKNVIEAIDTALLKIYREEVL